MGTTPLIDVRVVEFLGNIPLFAGLNRARLVELRMLSEDFEARSGELLFGEGDEADGLYIITRGDLEVSVRGGGGRRLVLARLGTGSVVGEMALIAGGERSATVAAVSPATGLFLPRATFEELRESGSLLADLIMRQLARILTRRRRRLEERIRHILDDPSAPEDLMRPSTRELIARFRKA